MPKAYAVVAADQNMGIGKDGDIPWKLKDDLRFFRETTSKTEDPEKQNLALMGRVTWESIPEEHRPLKGRKNVVITRNPDYEAEGAVVVHSVEDAYALADDSVESIMLVGGGRVYQECLDKGLMDGIYLTELQATFDCDTFFPAFSKEEFSKRTSLGENEENGIKYEYVLYEKED